MKTSRRQFAATLLTGGVSLFLPKTITPMRWKAAPKALLVNPNYIPTGYNGWVLCFDESSRVNWKELLSHKEFPHNAGITLREVHT